MQTLWQDLRYGARMLLKKPGFTLIAVITLALGIGANTAIFSVVNSILLRPLGYKDPEQLILVYHYYPKLDLKSSVSAIGYTHYREVSKSFANITAYAPWPVNMSGAGDPERLEGASVTATFFPTLGVDVAQGRGFSAGDDQQGRNKVVVISDSLWRRRFGADPNLIGKTLTLNSESYTVIGITPPDFHFGREFGQAMDLWAPLAFTQNQLQTTQWRNDLFNVIARLKSGVNLQQAQSEMDSIAVNVRQQYFTGAAAKDPRSWTLAVRGLHELVVGDIRPALLVLTAAVGLVLLIACANVANLQMARAASRQKEMAIRAALGASRARVIRQLLTESVLLALAGGGCGLLLAWWGVKVLIGLNQTNIPRAHEIGLDGRVLAFTFGISLLTGLLFGLLPALSASKTDLHETLKEGGQDWTVSSRRGMRGLLVIGEVAITLVLLVGAGLLIRSFLRLQEVNPGFRPQNLLVMQLSLPSSKYREPQQKDGFFQQVLQQVSALPGVQSAGVSSSIPMSGVTSNSSFWIEGRQTPPGQTMPWGSSWFAGATYFRTMGIPLIKGRYFDDRDVVNAPGVVIIDETMARKYWLDEDPLGKRISVGERDPQGNLRWREIVGIVGHVKHIGLDGESPAQCYTPHRQMLPSLPSIFLVLRTDSEPSSLASAVRATIQSVDKELPVFKVTTVEQIVADSTAQRRFVMYVLGIFGIVALVLAAVGLYGVMSYSVAQRTHEIGIRMALGARASDVLALIVKQGMSMALIGVIIGVALALSLTRVMASLLFGVRATDPVTFIAFSLALAFIALLACYIPARRATKVDPMVALRCE